jgi:hypothetical protein
MSGFEVDRLGPHRKRCHSLIHAIDTYALFAWLISHQTAVLFSQNKLDTNNQPTILFSRNKPASAISHQPNEQAISQVFESRRQPEVCRCN